MKYIRLMHIYHILTSSVRTGDFDLYVTLNHVNYAQWLVTYGDALIKFPHTLSEVSKILITDGLMLKE